MSAVDPEIVRAGDHLSRLFDALVDAGLWVTLRYEPCRIYITTLSASRRHAPDGRVTWIRCLEVEGRACFGTHPGLVFGPVDDLAATVAAIQAYVDEPATVPAS